MSPCFAAGELSLWRGLSRPWYASMTAEEELAPSVIGQAVHYRAID